MKRNFFIEIVCLVVVVLLFINAFTSRTIPPTQTISVGGALVSVEVADTIASRTQGLSGRDSLGINSGLLFVFDEPEEVGIWMKDMKFPIDIIWIDEEGVVIDVVEGATPESYPTVYTPYRDATYVLEVNSGFASTHRIRSGTRVTF